MTAKILVVEDEAVVAMEIQSTLERLGYFVIGIENTGEGAINKTKEAKPDLVLMDIRIKGEMDGIEAASRIRSVSEIPLIFLTAYAEEDKLERAKLTLPYGYILKPFQDRDLKVMVEMALYAAKIELERKQAVDDLRAMHLELERKVIERTAELEIAKEKAESANQMKSDFLANISHELRNPLHHILSFARFGLNKTGLIPNDKIIHYFKTITESGSSLLNILNDLLDLSKLKSGKMDYQMSETSIGMILNSTVNESSSTLVEKDIDMVYAEPPESMKLVCDPEKIRQVVRNLLSNAIKFSPPGGKITIAYELGRLAAGDETFNSAMVPALHLTVRDEGPGIPENELESIFDKFVQSSKTINSYGGTGLGLTICREIIQSHMGRIWIENNLAGGATFCILLPCEQDVSPDNMTRKVS
ncbi:MAG: response regulator [Deltaproteobacteria bacterium]|nr:response regulator [Deltaproteobacteria bacterium]